MFKQVFKQTFTFIGLLSFLALSFLLQQQFYTLELGLAYGTYLLCLIEGTKLGTELALFSKIDFKSTTRKIISKFAIVILALVVIGMSFYATKETILGLNQTNVNKAVKQRKQLQETNKTLADKKNILKQEIKTLTDQINTNAKLLISYSKKPANFWKVNIRSMQREQSDLKKRLSKLNKELLKLTEKRTMFIAPSNTEKHKMNEIVVYILALFMEAGVMFLCWFSSKSFIKPKETKTQTPQTKGQTYQTQPKFKSRQFSQNQAYAQQSSKQQTIVINTVNKESVMNAEKLKKIRNQMKLTQEQFADYLSNRLGQTITRSAITYWETSRTEIPDNIWQVLENKLVDIDLYKK